MKRFGATLIFLGIGSWVMPLLGMQFRLMSALQSGQPWAGMGVAALGWLLVYLGSLHERRRAGSIAPAKTTRQPPPPPPMQSQPSVAGCPRCRKPVAAGDAYCGDCGAKLAPIATPSAKPAVRRRSSAGIFLLIMAAALIAIAIFVIQRERIAIQWFENQRLQRAQALPVAPDVSDPAGLSAPAGAIERQLTPGLDDGGPEPRN